MRASVAGLCLDDLALLCGAQAAAMPGARADPPESRMTRPSLGTLDPRRSPVGMKRPSLRARPESTGSPARSVRWWAAVGLLALVAGLAPRWARAEDGWAAGRQFGLSDSAAGREDADAPTSDPRLVAAGPASPVQVAQAGPTATDASPSGWQFRFAPYLWATRVRASLAVGPVHRDLTVDFVDIVPQLHFAAAGHFEATWHAWTGFLDVNYSSVGKSETQQGVSVSTGLQNGMFEFGGTYLLGPVALGGAGTLTVEPLVGGRFIWVHTSLGSPNQKPTGSADVIDPMVGGRITYHLTDTVALWFRGDVAGFGISDDQTKLTYNLLGGLEWRFSRPASAILGWRYMDIDLRHKRITEDVSLNGPFLAVNFHF